MEGDGGIRTGYGVGTSPCHPKLKIAWVESHASLFWCLLGSCLMKSTPSLVTDLDGGRKPREGYSLIMPSTKCN